MLPSMRRIFSATFVLLSVAVFVPSMVAANIRIEPRLEDPVTGVVTLIATNFPLDLLLVSSAVYGSLVVLGKGVGELAEDSRDFIAAVVVASIAIAITGGFIDFVFLYERVDDHYLLRDLTLGVILPAAVLVFATIAIFLYAFVSVRPSASLAIAAVVGPISPVGWWFGGQVLGRAALCGVIVIVLLSVLALVVLVLLRLVHGVTFSEDGKEAYEGGRP